MAPFPGDSPETPVWHLDAARGPSTPSLDVVEAATIDLHELPPVPGVRYRAFTDPASGSAGSGGDSFTIGVSHKDRDKVVLDCVREVRPPFSPQAVVADYCEVLKSYRVASVVGDRWAAGFAAEAFKQHGVSYSPSEKSKSQLYAELLPLLNSGRVVLPCNDRLVHQITLLERRTGRGTGRDNIDHPPGGHDDVANAAAGACAAGSKYKYLSDMSWVSDSSSADEAARAAERWQAARFQAHILSTGGFFPRAVVAAMVKWR